MAKRRFQKAGRFAFSLGAHVEKEIASYAAVRFGLEYLVANHSGVLANASNEKTSHKFLGKGDYDVDFSGIRPNLAIVYRWE